jgi:hypothetical protein
MKTSADAYKTLDLLVTEWFYRQCAEPHRREYLYYLQSSPEHDGGLVIYSEQPPNPDYKLATGEPLNGFATVEANVTRFWGMVKRLPILTPVEWETGDWEQHAPFKGAVGYWKNTQT